MIPKNEGIKENSEKYNVGVLRKCVIYILM